MVDALAAEQAEAVAPAPPEPALTLAQIEALIQQKTNQRVAGLQSMYDRKIKDLADENKRISRSLAGTEDDVRQTDLEAEVRRLERRSKMLEAALEHPEIAPYLNRLDADATPEDIISAFTEYRQSFAPPAPPTPSTTTAPAVEVPGVVANNPRRDTSGWEEGQEMTEQLAQMILSR